MVGILPVLAAAVHHVRAEGRELRWGDHLAAGGGGGLHAWKRSCSYPNVCVEQSLSSDQLPHEDRSAGGQRVGPNLHVPVGAAPDEVGRCVKTQGLEDHSLDILELAHIRGLQGRRGGEEGRGGGEEGQGAEDQLVHIRGLGWDREGRGVRAGGWGPVRSRGKGKKGQRSTR